MSKAILLYVLWILPLPGLLLDQNYSSFNIKNVGTIVMLLQNKKQKVKTLLVTKSSCCPGCHFLVNTLFSGHCL